MNPGLLELLKKETGDTIISTSIDVRTTPLDTPEQVWEQVNVFNFDSGWICLTDRVVPLYSNGDLAACAGGIILSAELAGNAETLHIRQSENGWTMTRLKTGEGENCLMLREEYLSTENRQKARLFYEIYWKSENGVNRPYVARFAGIEKGGDN